MTPRATLPCLIALSLFALPPAARAQPTITSADLLGLIGTSQLVEIDSSATITVDVGNPGANQTWDYRALEIDPIQFGFEYLAPAATPFADAFPGANFVQKFDVELDEGDFELYNYSMVSPSMFVNLGQASSFSAPFDTTFITYDDDDVAPLPLTFGTEWTSVSADTSGLLPAFGFITVDTTVNVVDAWGTVRLPAGDFQTLRIRSDTKEMQQTIAAGQVIFSETTTRIGYSWVSADEFLVAEVESEDGETDPNFTTAISFLRVASGGTTPNERTAGLPGAELRLEPYPNPARFGSTIAYRIARDTRVDLAVYDVLGRRVRTLVDATRPSGEHRARWDGLDERGNRVAPGVYLIRLDTDTASATRQVTVVR